ncbi:MAG: pyruvate ferredoxin oxidoreductase [Desulfobacteraceae bacterium]|nr:MAG: pyruvate ferredoxin oxidoreductase [Desulfobacteraceae bacterium]
MKEFNIYITGVGGQGIGLLSQALLQAIDHAGLDAVAVDTHGLAQRGGVVASRIRFGEQVYSPLTMKHRSDLVLAMEIHEALRGVNTAVKDSGALVYLDVSWQPLPVRISGEKPMTNDDISKTCHARQVQVFRVESHKIPDPRMQNMAVLGTLAGHGLVRGVEKNHYLSALEAVLPEKIREANINLFESYMSV